MNSEEVEEKLKLKVSTCTPQDPSLEPSASNLEGASPSKPPLTPFLLEEGAGEVISEAVGEKTSGMDRQCCHVNKGGFPIGEDTWEEMWQHVTETRPNGAAIANSIRGMACRKVEVFLIHVQNMRSTQMEPLQRGHM